MRPDVRAIIAAEVKEELGHRSEPYPCAGADGARKATDRGMRFGSRGAPLHMCAWILCVPAVVTEGLGRARVVSDAPPVSILIPQDVALRAHEQAEVCLAAGCNAPDAA
jgi:hypothetical protein